MVLSSNDGRVTLILLSVTPPLMITRRLDTKTATPAFRPPLHSPATANTRGGVALALRLTRTTVAVVVVAAAAVVGPRHTVLWRYQIVR